MALLQEATLKNKKYPLASLKFQGYPKYCYTKVPNQTANCLRKFQHDGAHIAYVGDYAAVAVWYTQS